jgi:hypothetical protein
LPAFWDARRKWRSTTNRIWTPKRGNIIADDPKAPVQRTVPRSPDQATIDIRVEDGNPIGLNVPRTFGQNSTSFTSSQCDFGVPITVRLVVIMTFDPKTTKEKRLAAESLVRSAWLSAWPKFGFAYVTGFTIGETYRVQQRAQQQPQNKPIVVTQTLTFSLRPKLSQLV